MNKAITNDSKLTQRASLFADGAKGMFMQTYDVYVDGEPIAMSIVVTRESRDKPIVRRFVTDVDAFENLRDAFESIGYSWTREGPTS